MFAVIGAAGFGLSLSVSAANIEYLQPKPLNVRQEAAPVKPGAEKNIPAITWGGDVATFYGVREGIIDGKVFVQNNVEEQVKGILSGETPWFRGTVGMYATANSALKANGVELVAVYQLTWSTGDDTITSRAEIQNPAGLRGKIIVVQLYGPHMDFIANTLRNASLAISDVNLKFVRELTIPSEDKGVIVDPVTAFESDRSIDAITAIWPDADTLSRESEGQGAKILFSTKTASTVIADLYFVRKDFLEQNPDKVQTFVHQNLKAEEAFRDFLKSKQPADKNVNDSQLNPVLTECAGKMFDDPGATDLVAGMLLGGCTWVGYDGNVAFFTGQTVKGKAVPRNFRKLVSEILPVFREIGVVSKDFVPAAAPLDYGELANGLSYANKVETGPKFDSNKVTTVLLAKTSTAADANRLKINQALQSGTDISSAELDFQAEGELFIVPVKFATGQFQFDSQRYEADYQQILDLFTTYGGALLEVNGHADPYKYQAEMKKGLPTRGLNQIRDAAKALSMRRAQAVRNSFIAWARTKGVEIEKSQIQAQGLGIDFPKHPIVKSRANQADNRRCEFRIVNVEAEGLEFPE